jgi:benzoyl-CoA reductase/2-hydroxyglutaryl-CoA dehydratase subunit BcrC/BadD/HgdB
MSHFDGYTELLKGLGVDIERYDRMCSSSDRLFAQMFLTRPLRPAAMKLFDTAFADAHGARVAEVAEHRNRGGKVIGTFCIYVPDEIALAAGVLPLPLCGGSNWAVDYADKMFPREICPLIRSTFGLSFSNTCPYKHQLDGHVGETTCDAKKKAWDLLGFEVLEVPQKKADQDRALWHAEVRRFKMYVERIAGREITPGCLSESIGLVNQRRRVLQQLSAFRKLPEPPISGLDALLVSQVALNQEIRSFIQAGETLVKELESRVAQGISAYEAPGPRVLVAGSPSPMGNAKVHFALESSGLRVVADESCTGMRYFRDLADESATDMEGMVAAIADRYFAIDCSCFSPNLERIDNVTHIVKEFAIDGVVHNILSFCHTYNIEAKAVDRALGRLRIPSLKIVTDYSFEDIEQLKVRVQSFEELLHSTVKEI